MDKAEAIKRIKDHIRVHHIGKYPHIKIEEALNMAISALANDNNVGHKVEVVHGEWVVCGDGEYVPFMCSACGKTTSWYHAQTANYCPNCGAKMVGERKDNE